MDQMFHGASSFNQDISKWDTSKCKFFGYMFLNATNFLQDIRVWDTSSVNDRVFFGMFEGATRMLEAYPELATEEGIKAWFESVDDGIYMA
jgi:surface protein